MKAMYQSNEVNAVTILARFDKLLVRAVTNFLLNANSSFIPGHNTKQTANPRIVPTITEGSNGIPKIILFAIPVIEPPTIPIPSGFCESEKREVCTDPAISFATLRPMTIISEASSVI